MTAVQPIEVAAGPTTQFPVLDTMRAVGAVAVLTTHVAFWAGDYTDNGIWGTALARLDVGVAIFFVLSGFLLSRPLLENAARRLPAPSVKRYLWKRFLRIFPLYTVVAVLALTLLAENSDRGVRGWLTTLTLTDLYFSESLPAGLTQMWSLSTEVAFYVALPGLMLLATGRRANGLRTARLVLVLTAMLVLNLVWLLELAARLPSHNMALQWLPGYLSWFAVGIGISYVHVLVRSGKDAGWARWVSALGRSPGSCWVMALSLFAVASTPLAGPSLLAPATLGEAVTKNLLYAAIGGLLILPGVFAAAESRYVTVLSWGPLRHVGHISYSIFAVHLLVLHLVMDVTGYPLFGGHGWQIFGLTLSISVVASEILYRVVERPMMRLKDWPAHG
jgi:peptidoglycan/LPS O-acetylase OafA/YrhL